MAKQEKKEQVTKLAEMMKAAKSVAFVDYAGMSVQAQEELKKKLREAEGTMLVAKNTLLKIAGAEAKMPEEAFSDAVLAGQTAMIAGGDDPVSPIQVLGKYIDENEVPQFKAGVVEGVFQNKEGLVQISKLPGKRELAGRAVGAIAGPLYGLVGTLQGNTQKLIFMLNAKASEVGR